MSLLVSPLAPFCELDSVWTPVRLSLRALPPPADVYLHVGHGILCGGVVLCGDLVPVEVLHILQGIE